MALSRRTGRLLGTQVHHIVPLQTLSIASRRWDRKLGRSVEITRKVRHADSGCWHHVDGLETLCDDCHHETHHGPIIEQLAIEFA